MVEKGYLVAPETADKLADILEDAGFMLSILWDYPPREEMPELVVRQRLGPKSSTTDK